jgi:hypothetical protein
MLLKRTDIRNAEAFFDTYEHLGNCGLGVWHWGAVENSRVIGVVSFGTTCFARSRGLLSMVANQFGLAIYQICRGGTIHTTPVNTPSRILSCAMRELRRDRGDCLIVAYSDRAYNEVGTIYQACNGLYIGQTEPKNQSNYVINGRTMSGWLVRKKYGTRAMEELRKIDPHVLKMPLTRKYRYVFIQASRRVKGKVVKMLAPFVSPYPRRESENIQAMNIAGLVCRRTHAGNGVLPTPDDIPVSAKAILPDCSGALEIR